MGSISNPEIRRMELMAQIAGIERVAMQRGDIGMFVTITTPSKYHPTKVTGKKDEKRPLLIITGRKRLTRQRTDRHILFASGRKYGLLSKTTG